MSVTRPPLLTAAAAAMSAACVVAMAGTAFAMDAHRLPDTVVSTTAPAPDPTGAVATTPAIAPG